MTKIRVEINELETRSTVEQITELEALFLRESIKLIGHWQNLYKRKEKGPKLIKLLMKKERSRPTPIKLEGLLETSINSYMPIN